MDRQHILNAAMKCVTVTRQADHGDAFGVFKDTADFWSTYTGCTITPSDVGAMMILHKTAR